MTAADVDEPESGPDEDLDIPTFLRKEKKHNSGLRLVEPTRLPGRTQSPENEMLRFLERLNHRLNHEYACVETVVSIDDLKRYGLPHDIASRLKPFIGTECNESCVVAAFLHKLARHPNYESVLSPRVRDLIQNFVQSQGIMCVQLEPGIHPIVYQAV